MPFKKSFEFFLHKSNNNIMIINSNKQTTINVFNQFFQNISSFTLLNNHCNSLDMCFDIDDEDTIYGIINDKSGIVYFYNITNNLCIGNSIINYNKDLYTLKCLCIKKINVH